MKFNGEQSELVTLLRAELQTANSERAKWEVLANDRADELIALKKRPLVGKKQEDDIVKVARKSMDLFAVDAHTYQAAVRLIEWVDASKKDSDDFEMGSKDDPAFGPLPSRSR